MNHVRRQGWIECIAGCMFSGKSVEIIRRMRRGVYAKQQVIGVKPAVDDRYGISITTHDGLSFTAVSVSDSASILAIPGVVDAHVVGIDEVQFFDEGIVDVCLSLAADGKCVIVAGLDTDYRGIPFGPVPQLLAVADYVTKIHAVCTSCGETATRTQRIVDNQDQVVIGGSSAYEARCRRHWSPEPVFTRREALGALDD